MKKLKFLFIVDLILLSLLIGCIVYTSYAEPIRTHSSAGGTF